MQPIGPIKSVVATGETGAKKFSLASKNVSYKSINLHSFIIYFQGPATTDESKGGVSPPYISKIAILVFFGAVHK